MTLETVKEIGNIVQALGETGTTAFIWFIVADMLRTIILPVTFGVVAIIIRKGVLMAYKANCRCGGYV
jgi:hypothetical protein